MCRRFESGFDVGKGGKGADICKGSRARGTAGARAHRAARVGDYAVVQTCWTHLGPSSARRPRSTEGPSGRLAAETSTPSPCSRGFLNRVSQGRFLKALS